MPAAGCYVFFRYDSRRQAGYYIKRQWSGAGGATVLGVCDAAGDRALASASDPAQYPVAEWTEIRLEVRGDIFRVLHNGSPVARFRDRNPRLPGAGQVGFDRDRPSENGARGPFWLRRIRLTSSRAPAPSVLWKPLRIKFPAEHNGIVSPFFYELEAAAYANHVQITARLTGGPAERDDPVLLRGRAPGAMRWQNERLLNPYLRLERPGGGDLGAHYLFRGSVGLKEHWIAGPPGCRRRISNAPWNGLCVCPHCRPVNVFVGYEYYEAEERNWMKGGPTEAWIDPTRGRIIASGAPLKANDVLFEIGSPPDKMMPDDPGAHAAESRGHGVCQGQPLLHGKRTRAVPHCGAASPAGMPRARPAGGMDAGRRFPPAAAAGGCTLPAARARSRGAAVAARFRRCCADRTGMVARPPAAGSLPCRRPALRGPASNGGSPARL